MSETEAVNLNDDSPSQPLCPLMAPPRHEPSSWWKSTCALPLPLLCTNLASASKSNWMPLAHFLHRPSISSCFESTLQTYKKNWVWVRIIVKVGEGFWGMLFVTPSSWRRIWRRNGHTQPSLDAVGEGEVDSQPRAAASSGAPVWGAGGHRTEQGANQRDHQAAEPARWDSGSKCPLLVSESKSPWEAETAAGGYEGLPQSAPAKNPTWKSSRPEQGEPFHRFVSFDLKLIYLVNTVWVTKQTYGILLTKRCYSLSYPHCCPQ